MLIGSFDVLPATVTFKEKRVKYSVRSRAMNGAGAQQMLGATVPDPMLIIPLGLTAHSAELEILSAHSGIALETTPRVGTSRVEIRATDLTMTAGSYGTTRCICSINRGQRHSFLKTSKASLTRATRKPCTSFWIASGKRVISPSILC